MKVSDVLPSQSHYYLLTNGKRYAIHGSGPDSCGLLVFTIREQAEQFVMTVADRSGKSGFQPVKVSQRKMIDELAKVGGLCLWRQDGNLIVGKIKP